MTFNNISNNNDTITAAPVSINDTTTTGMDLVAIERQAIDALNRKSATSDLDAFVRGFRRSLLLVDCSGSMADRLERTNERRIDALRRVLRQLRSTHSAPIAAFGGCRQVEIVEDAPEPTGSTPLDDAIDFGREQGANHLVVITDGEPNSQASAFEAAARFGNPIDVFYIGDAHGFGLTFARELARRTGGEAHLSDVSATKQLSSQIAGLLGDGN
jgi:Mg-chelatase subunit ChlD